MKLRPKLTLIFDVECYPNMWCVTFYDPVTGRTRTFIKTPNGPAMDLDALKKLMETHRIVSFNGINYDVPMVYYALSGASNKALKKASDTIITENLKPWVFEKLAKIRIPKLDHIDIIEVAPGIVSLKLYGGRLHAPTLQDLPYDPDMVLTQAQIDEVVRYNINDLHTTWLLFKALEKQIELRERMFDQADTDLRSKKDAQIAAAVIKHQMTQLDGRAPEKNAIRPGTKFRYDPPSYLSFQTPTMQKVLADVCAAEFEVLDTGKVRIPKTVEGRIVELAGVACRMGIGGLHSTEESVAYHSDDEYVLQDNDAESFYPRLMLTLGLAPRHLGTSFLKVLGKIVTTRVTAKRSIAGAIGAGDTALLAVLQVTADSLKIVVNSTFGLTGSKYSFLYDPKIMIQVTLSGQLLLLWLVEKAHLAGIHVVSANTDGIVVRVKRDRVDEWNAVIAEWEVMTKLKTEETIYDHLYSRDVNNYIAIKPGGKTKNKGVFTETGPQKNPQFEICVKAVVDHITKGIPVEETIRGCTDIRQFVSCRTVKGGAYFKEDRYLGKVVRWYLAEGSQGFIRTKATDPRTGNWKTVAKTRGCLPLMTLPDELPDDVDLRAYIAEAKELLMNIGYYQRPPPPPKMVRLTKANTVPLLMLWALASAA